MTKQELSELYKQYAEIEDSYFMFLSSTNSWHKDYNQPSVSSYICKWKVTNDYRESVEQAYRDGASIEINSSGEWCDWLCDREPFWKWDRNKYRVKEIKKWKPKRGGFA